jgi:hypothetical protein
MRVHYYNNIAPPGDYQITSTHTDTTLTITAGAAEAPEPGEAELKNLFDWEWCNANFSPLPAGFGSTAVLGVPDCAKLLANMPEHFTAFGTMAYRNRGYRSWAVTAVGLWFTALPVQAITMMRESNWLRVPLCEWKDKLETILVGIRRTMRVHSAWELSADALLKFRKLPSVTYREKGEADWVAEKLRRTSSVPWHYCPTENGWADRELWYRRLHSHLRRVVHGAVATMANTLRLEDLPTWWDSRFAWAPGGSSSTHSHWERVLGESQQLPKNSRANKKVALAMMPDDYIAKAYLKRPYKNPRASTKVEPGGKLRALYATDDDSFIIASYASVAVEKFINVEGIMAQQAPTDVAEWVKKHILYRDTGAFYQSLDYTDFNTEHETLSLWLLDTVWCEAWGRSSLRNPVKVAKMLSSFWAAEAHFNAWVSFPKEQPTRVYAGLFSGDRNTARDNCLLHAAYSGIACDMSRDRDPNFRILEKFFTGDDEDCIFSDWISALIYQVAHTDMGFVLKGRKQLTGDKLVPSHEYLQRTLLGSYKPYRPLCSALSQLCSGNWYQTNYVWLDGIISSVNDNCWELHTRGLPLLAARACAMAILDRALQVRGPETWQKKEWWRFRTNGRYHPLWDTVSSVAPAVPTGSEVVLVPTRAPGLDAWVAKAKRRFQGGITAAAITHYRKGVGQLGFGNLYKKERNVAMHRAAYHGWPQREAVDHWSDCLQSSAPTATSVQWIENLLLSGYAVRHPTTIASLVSRWGLDDQLLMAVGGLHKLLPMLSHDDVAQAENVYPEPVPYWWLRYEDQSIQSWMRQAVGTNQGVLLVERPPRRMLLQDVKKDNAVNVLCAGNGMGKSHAWYYMQCSGIVDGDDLIRRAGVSAAIKTATKNGDTTISSCIHSRIATQLQQSGVRWLLTQYPASWVVQWLKLAEKQLGKVYAIEHIMPDAVDHLQAARDWSLDRVTRRQRRLTNTIAEWKRISQDVIILDSPTAMQAITEILATTEQKDKNQQKQL